ncbi:MAG: peroxide stress protein YaaA [Opitutae bacterium]
MLVLLSPAKTLDFESPTPTQICTKPDFLDLSEDLTKGLSELSTEELGRLMGLSPKLAQLNYDRFQTWSKEHRENTSKQAITAFKGDVYEGLKAWNFNQGDFEYAQKNLRILSGLYGILKPLDLIQPYRLEMGTVYANPAGKDLYAFWGDKLANSIKKDLALSKSKTILNLASLEYSKAAQLKKVDANIISPAFKDEKNGKFKMISFYAKRARGLMTNFIITNKIESENDIKEFSMDGYSYSIKDSSANEPVFLRSEKARNAA